MNSSFVKLQHGRSTWQHSLLSSMQRNAPLCSPPQSRGFGEGWKSKDAATSEKKPTPKPDVDTSAVAQTGPGSPTVPSGVPLPPACGGSPTTAQQALDVMQKLAAHLASRGLLHCCNPACVMLRVALAARGIRIPSRLVCGFTVVQIGGQECCSDHVWLEAADGVVLDVGNEVMRHALRAREGSDNAMPATLLAASLPPGAIHVFTSAAGMNGFSVDRARVGGTEYVLAERQTLKAGERWILGKAARPCGPGDAVAGPAVLGVEAQLRAIEADGTGQVLDQFWLGAPPQVQALRREVQRLFC